MLRLGRLGSSLVVAEVRNVGSPWLDSWILGLDATSTLHLKRKELKRVPIE